MKPADQNSWFSWTLGAYLCIGVAIALVVLIGAWGASQEIGSVRQAELHHSIAPLRARAERTVGHLEDGLTGQTDQVNIHALRDNPWLRRYWETVVVRSQKHLFAAIVDSGGTIVLHTDPALEQKQLGRQWYERIVSEAGGDVLEVRANPLSAGKPAFDVRFPIVVAGNEVGAYHEGLSTESFEQQIAEQRAEILRRWVLLIGAILVVVLLGAAALYAVGIRSVGLHHAVSLAELRRVTELGQIAAGLAHEIRNPLHALRLNLHALSRAGNGRAPFSREEVETIRRESDEEIDRIDRLMKELLGFASPDAAREEDVDVSAELQSTLRFLGQEISRKKIDLETQIPPRPVWVHMDRGRLRQVIMNLLINAYEAAGKGGKIKLAVRQQLGNVQISVADDGPGVPEKDHEKIFDPFYSTKEGSVGFGLALVRRFVGEAGGDVHCESSNGDGGAEFQIVLPEAAKSTPRK